MSTSSRKMKNIFYCYAPEDKKLLVELETHLKPSPLWETWYDGKILPSTLRNKEIDKRLNEADIILLLLSPDFIASAPCQNQVQRSLQRQSTENVKIVPILLRAIKEVKDGTFLGLQLLPSDGKPVKNYPDRDIAFTDIADNIQKLVEQDTDIQRLSNPSSAPYQDIVPQQTSVLRISPPANGLFINRVNELATIADAFASAQDLATPIVALKGLAGMGKTQIAQVYSSSHSSAYQDILWINGSSRALLSKDLSAYAAQFSLAVEDEKNEQQLFTAFQRWLQHRPDWLLVLDHLHDIALVKLIVPPRSHGHVLLTTQAQSTAGHAIPLIVASMDADASILFLLRRATLIEAGDSLAAAPTDMIQQARAITEALGGLPLALDQAGAYIEETGCKLSTYLKLYEQKRSWVLSQGRQATDERPASVMGTFELVFEQFAQRPGADLDLLHLLAFLHPDFISETLLEEGGFVLDEPLRTLVSDAQTRLQAFAALLSISLLYRSPDDKEMLQMHRMVQTVLIDKLSQEQQHGWALMAVRLVNHVFPEVSFATWEDCKRYLPHAQRCAELITTYELTIKAGASLLERLGTYRLRQAAYAEAETYLARALRLYEDHLQDEALDAAQTTNSLALLHTELARYQQALDLHLRALELRELELSADHPKTAESLHNLAATYAGQGLYALAEDFYQRARELEEHSKGPDHPDVARTLNNLGTLYFDQKRYSEAEALYHRALSIYQRSPDAEELDLIHPLDGLGSVAEQQGNLQQAERFYKRALAISKRTWGKNHPETAHSLNKLAGLAELRGDNQKAEKLYRQALTIGERALGPDHPDVALFLNNLAFLANKQEQYQKAEPLHQRALAIYEGQPEPHPHTALFFNNLARFYRNTHNAQQAEAYLRSALAIQKQFLAPTDPDITLNLNTLADVLVDQQRYEEAAPLLHRALAILLLGTASPEHPQIEAVRGKYATLLERLQRNEEAQEVRRGILKQEDGSSPEADLDAH